MITLHDITIGNYRVSQRFGSRPEVYKQFNLNGHDGVDWACPTGTQLISPVDGVIIAARYDKNGYGTHIKILDWNQRCCVLMGHMKSISVNLGQTVKIGQLVGISDNTGFSSGSHLHLGVCQTNALGYRINRNNGFLGWINPLDKKLVKWVVSNPASPLSI